MKVKIKDKIYNAEKEPIMIILSKYDKDYISYMAKMRQKLCCPATYQLKKTDKFMKI